MNDEDIKKLQNLIEKIGDALENACEKFGIENETDLSQAAMLDVVQYLMFLGASDNEITWQETDLISRICGINFTPGLIGKYIREHDIYSVRFEHQIPATFGMLVNTEKLVRNLDGEKLDISAQILTIYKLIGEAFLALSPENKTAVENYRSYIGMMEEFMAKELSDCNESARGFVKRGAEDQNGVASGKAQPVVSDENVDIGVEAPKKG